MSYNYLGREIYPSDIEFISSEYGKKENGTITVFGEHSDIVDDYGFDSPGGAIQLLQKRSINEEVATGRLKEVYGWLEKKI